MQLFIKGLETTVLEVAEGETVEALKDRLSNSEGIPVEDQVLSYTGRPLEDEETLEAYGITDLSTISVEVRMLGGGPLSTLALHYLFTILL